MFRALLTHRSQCDRSPLPAGEGIGTSPSFTSSNYDLQKERPIRRDGEVSQGRSLPNILFRYGFNKLCNNDKADVAVCPVASVVAGG